MITQTKKVLVAAKKFEKLELEEEPFGVTFKEEEVEALEEAEVMVEAAVTGEVVAAVELGRGLKGKSQTIGPTRIRVTTQQELRDQFPNWQAMTTEPWMMQKKKLKYQSSKKLTWI